MIDSDPSAAKASWPEHLVSDLRKTGRLPGLRWCPSPNFDARPAGEMISLLVVHNISLPPGEFGGSAIEEFFCNRLDHEAHPYFRSIAGLRVSAHVLIRRNGEAIQFVNLLDRAWHAGRSCFRGRQACNDFSIGIELEGTDDCPYTGAQYRRLAQLTSLIMAAWPQIDTDRITGHCDIAPDRKTDPGPAFDWPYFYRQLAMAGGTGHGEAG